MKSKKLLIGTTSEGKYKEISSFLGDLPFDLLSLNDLDEKIKEPKETGKTIEENALIKAKYYAKKTGFLTVTDDTGLYINALNGWPGIKTGRELKKDNDNFEVLREKMRDIPNKERGAEFKCILVVYDPEEESYFSSYGKLEGEIMHEPCNKEGENKWGYNKMFYVPEINKSFGEISVKEKNEISHRGKALAKMKYFLQRQYRGKHYVVPIGLVVREGKVLMGLRNDPHRPQHHKKWEFPGGSVELGEQIEENLVREVKEEIGYDVEVVKLLQSIVTAYRKKHNYQVYILPYVCKIIGGNGKYNDSEMIKTKWFDFDDVLNYDLVGENAEFYEKVLDELKKVVEEFDL